MTRSNTDFVRHIFGMRTSIMRWTDTEGRPLHEGQSPSEVWPAEMSRVRCKYADTRAQSPLLMNVSALASVSRDTPFVHQALRALRRQLFELAPGEPATILQMSHIVSTGWNMAYWQFYAATIRGGPAPALDPQFASLFKVCIGLSWLARLLLKSLPARATVTPRDLLAHVDRTRALVGTHEVCAAPLEMVGTVLETLITGTPARIKAPPPRALPGALAASAYAKVQHDVIYWLTACKERALRECPALTTLSEQRPMPAWLPWWLAPGLQKEAFELRWNGSDPARAIAPSPFVYAARDRLTLKRLSNELVLEPSVTRRVAATIAAADRRFARAGGELAKYVSGPPTHP